MSRILVAMSGGVDSSVAAAILKKQGHFVAGANMLLSPEATEKDALDAKNVAEKLDIPFYIFDFREKFEQSVINPFCNSYYNGETPNPCVFCNKAIKFGMFLDKAIELGFDKISTGHYAYITEENGVFKLNRASSDKDQTYVLYNMNQHILSHTVFPLAKMDNKEEVRSIAAEVGLEIANKPDSQEICFIKDNNYAKYISERMDTEDKCGDFIDLDGNVIGRHKGIIHYTIGQRKGLGGGFAEPKFVVGINPKKNQVVLGSNNDVFSCALIGKNANYLSGNTPESPIKIHAKVRYNSPAVPATLIPDGNNVRVEFDQPERAVTPGQAVVFYDGDTLIGGATIVSKA